MAAKKKSNNFLIQGSILAVTSLIVRIIGLVYRIPMQRIIGDEGMGIYNNTFELYNIALILSSYSLPIAVSRLVAVRRVNKEYRNTYRIFLCAMAFAFTVGLIATAVIFGGADFWAVLIYNDDNIALPLRVLAPTIFVFSVMGVLRGFFQGRNTMIPTAISQLLEQVVNAVVSIAAAYILIKNYSASANVASYGAAGGTLGTFCGALIGLIFLLFVFLIYKPVLNRHMRHDDDEYRESNKTIFRLLVITIVPIILSQTIYQISGVLDGTMFNHVMAKKQLTLFDIDTLKNSVPGELYVKKYREALMGIYGTKYKLLTNVPVAVATAIAAAIVTSLAAAYEKGMYEVINHKIHAAIKFNMIVAIPSAVGMGVLASPILRLIFHDNRVLPANFLRLGCLAIVFFALSTLSSAVLQGINQLRVPVINSSISLGIHIVLVILLLKYTSLSTYALVIGNVSFALVVCILNWLAIEKYLDYHQEIMKTFVIPSISSGLMGAVAYFSYKGFMHFIRSNTISTLAAILVAMIVYFVLLIFLKGIDEDELDYLPKGKLIIRVLKKLHLL